MIYVVKTVLSEKATPRTMRNKNYPTKAIKILIYFTFATPLK